MKIGVEVRIDVTKIDKARLYVGAKGKYLTMTTFIDLDQKDQYDNNGFIAHEKKQHEEGNPPILGNVKVFWKGEGLAQQPQQRPQTSNQPNPRQQNNMPADDFEDDIPFS
jgi:single-stranded DNA-binding protein